MRFLLLVCALLLLTGCAPALIGAGLGLLLVAPVIEQQKLEKVLREMTPEERSRVIPFLLSRPDPPPPLILPAPRFSSPTTTCTPLYDVHGKILSVQCW